MLGVPDLAAAQNGFGIRGGYSIDPDQGFVGVHFIAEISESFKLQPAADVGYGDGLALAAFHIDFANWFELGSGQWSVYVGGGTSVNIYRFDEPVPRPDGEIEQTDVEGGFDMLVGFARRKGPLFELRVGASGGPDLRLTVGFTF